MPGTAMSGGHANSGPMKKGAALGLQDATTDTTPPEGMSAEALHYWAKYAALQVRKGILTEGSRDALRSYCQTLVHRDRVEKELQESAMLIVSTVVDGAGNEHPKVSANPLVSLLLKIEGTLHQLATGLVLTNAAAMRVPRVPEPEVDPLAAWTASGRARIKAVK